CTGLPAVTTAGDRAHVEEVGVRLREEASHLRRDNTGASVARQKSIEEKILRGVVPVGVESNIRNLSIAPLRHALKRRGRQIGTDATPASAIVGRTTIRTPGPAYLVVVDWAAGQR